MKLNEKSKIYWYLKKIIISFDGLFAFSGQEDGNVVNYWNIDKYNIYMELDFLSFNLIKSHEFQKLLFYFII